MKSIRRLLSALVVPTTVIALAAELPAKDAAAPDAPPGKASSPEAKPGSDAGATSAAKDKTSPFQRLDADKDGRISLSEFVAPAKAAKKKSEEKAAQRPIPSDAVSSDAGILSGADSVEGRHSPEVFQNLDIDDDNQLTPAELEPLYLSAHKIEQP